MNLDSPQFVYDRSEELDDAICAIERLTLSFRGVDNPKAKAIVETLNAARAALEEITFERIQEALPETD